MYCRARPGTLTLGGVRVIRCESCGTYLDRLMASEDEQTQVYGWMLTILAVKRFWALHPPLKVRDAA